eukprot:TRINITY_DN6052_c0_g1_i1.p2 TRINITY_DN6052_c0_g1~~TRINITY_DN6052_c0_g1_i1.p2  ORF type:complete len:213 (+),score=67.35 TRINITY_DN6052_c0_g1_i1:129-767(+)
MLRLVVLFGVLTGLVCGQWATYIRVAHASPDAPNVDIIVNGSKFWNNLQFREVSYYLQDFEPGRSLEIQVTPTGEDYPYLIDTIITPQKGTANTLVLEGFFKDFAPQLLLDDQQRPQPGYSLVRFVHLSPDAPPVDIVVADVSPIVTDVSYTQYTNYTQMVAGSYHLQVMVSGSNLVILDLPDVDVPPMPISFYLEGSFNIDALTAVFSYDI